MNRFIAYHQVDATGKLRVLINNKPATLQWPKECTTPKLPIDQDLYPLVSFPKPMQGRVSLSGRSGIGLSLAEQALRKKLRKQVYEALACGQVVASRLAFEAVAKGDLALLRLLIDATPHFNSKISADGTKTPGEAAIAANNLALVQELMVKWSGASTEPFPPNSIASEIDTGQASSHTFTHRVGKIGAARGGKEGNGAFNDW